LTNTTRLREHLPRQIVRRSLRHPARVVALWLVLIAAALPGALRLRIETSTDSALDRESEPWAFYERSKETFGGDELIVVALSNGEPFAVELLDQTIRLTRRFEQIEGVRRVDSLASVPHIRSGEDGSLVLDAALESGVPETPDARAALLAALQRERIAPRSLLSDDGLVIALNLYLEAELDRSFDAVIGDIEAVVREVEGVDGISARVSGVPIFRTQVNLRTSSEVMFFSLITVALIGILFRILFGSLAATFVPLAIGGLAVWLILGTMGGIGVPLSLSTMILPSILLALACAYSTHFVFAMGRSTAGAGDAISRRRTGAEDVALPVVLSGLTTTIGFVAIAFVPIEAMREIGGLGAIGTLLITAAVSSLAPVMLDRWPPRVAVGAGERWFGGAGRRIILGLAAHPGRVVLVALGVGLVAGLGLPRLSLQTDATRWFSKGSPVRDDYESIRRDLSGISPINVVITPEDDAQVTEPAVLASIAALADHLRSIDDVGKVLSIADPLLSVHEVFDPTSRAIGSQALAEQYMLLLSSREPIWDLIEPGHRAANLLVRADDNGSDRLLALAEEAESWWAMHGAEGFRARATGIMFEFARAEDLIARGQIQGVQFAVVCVGLLLLLIFRSVWLAGAALVANLVPILIAFGGMAWLGIPLDAGTVVVANLALGIAVDDTIHVVALYDERPSLDRTLRRVLPALATTTLAVGLGFSVLGFSEFAFTRNLGVLTAIIMVLCFFGDILLLPCLIRLRSRAGAAQGSAAHEA